MKGKEVLPDIAASVRSKMEGKRDLHEDMAGVGIGVPAPVSEEGIVKNSANIGWGYKNVKKEMEELLPGVCARIGNDANVAALGEMWLGAGKGCSNMIMVTLGPAWVAVSSATDRSLRGPMEQAERSDISA